MSSHPYPLRGGNPLLKAALRSRAAPTVIHDPAPIDWLYGTLAALFMVGIIMLAGCATTAPQRANTDERAYSGQFDPRWMTLILVDAGTVAAYCRRDGTALGCAKVLADAGTPPPHPTDATHVPSYTRCLIYLDAGLVQPARALQYHATLEHEARHCRGWHHEGE